MATQNEEIDRMMLRRRRLLEEAEMVGSKINRLLQCGPQQNEGPGQEPDTSTEAGRRSAISRGLDIDAAMSQQTSRPSPCKNNSPTPHSAPLNALRKEELLNVAKGAAAMIGQQTNNANEAGFVLAAVSLLV